MGTFVASLGLKPVRMNCVRLVEQLPLFSSWLKGHRGFSVLSLYVIVAKTFAFLDEGYLYRDIT